MVVRLTDAAGNSSDSEKSVSVDGIALTGTLTGASDDEGVVTTTATLAFSAKPMEADVTFDKFALTRDGEAIALEGVTFAKVDDTTFTLTGLDSLCAEDGVYVLTFNGAAVRKYTSGLPMSGSLVMRWRYENPDREPPTVTEVLFDGETPHEVYTNGCVFSSVAVTFSEAVNVPELIANGLIGRAARIDLLDAANSVTGSAVIASAMTWDGESNTLSWQIDPLSVPAGRTRLVFDPTLITDMAGNHLAPAESQMFILGAKIFTSDLFKVGTAYSYACPVLHDWNGDGLLDLVVGEKTADGKGKVRIYLNRGTNNNAVFDDYTYLQKDGADIEFAAQGCVGMQVSFGNLLAETWCLPHRMAKSMSGTGTLLIGRSGSTTRRMLASRPSSVHRPSAATLTATESMRSLFRAELANVLDETDGVRWSDGHGMLPVHGCRRAKSPLPDGTEPYGGSDV